MEEVKTDVIVVGGGPAGLILACELRLAGVAALVLERLPEPTGRSKALNLQPRTAEILDLRGLLDRAKERSFTTVPEGHFATIPLSYNGWDTRHPYQVGIPQAQVEELLTERLAELRHSDEVALDGQRRQHPDGTRLQRPDPAGRARPLPRPLRRPDEPPEGHAIPRNQRRSHRRPERASTETKPR